MTWLLLTSSRRHLLTSSPSLANVICLCQHWPVAVELTECWLCWHRMLTSLIVNHWLSTGVDFLQSRCSLINFLHRFHFCNPFLHILLLNEEKNMSSSYCNNRYWQSNKRVGHNIETCYHHNKSVVFVSIFISNTKSIQPMAPISTKSKSSGLNITISTVDL